MIVTWSTCLDSGSQQSLPECRVSLHLIGEQEQPMGWQGAVVSPALLATNAAVHKATNSETQSRQYSAFISVFCLPFG